MTKPSLRFAMATLSSLGLAIGLSTLTASRLGAAEAMSPLPLKLPAPTLKGTPPDDPPKGPNIEPLDLEKKRPPFLAPAGVQNVALKKKVTISEAKPYSGEPALVTDGSKEATDDEVLELRRGLKYVQLDLEAPQQIYAVVVWLDHRYYHVIHDVVVQVADDDAFTKNVRTLFNNDSDNSAKLGAGTDKEYFETSQGKLIDAKRAVARHLRCYTQGSSTSSMNGFTEIEVWGRPAAP
ncbi:MAG: hypothetical protein HZA90_00270 [Verrucomicrobia bacterium]|nr:hypothetical protein [Verrucomicrobiota bacterium]